MNLRELISGWGRPILITSIIFAAMYIFCWPQTVDGMSMEPNFSTGDRVFACRFYKLVASINYGDLVVCRNEFAEKNKSILKRIVGLPGDLVQIRNGHVYINEELYFEPYVGQVTVGKVDLVLGEDEYFVLGDNRAVSADSRVFGPYSIERIVGVVFFRWYPMNGFGTTDNPYK